MCQRLMFVAIVFFFATDAVPLSENNLGNLELMKIPLGNGKELDLLSLTNGNGRLSERNKRTIGILRDLFPELTEQVDQSVNKLVSQLIRVVGPAVLRGAVRNNQGSINSRNNFDSDFEDSQENGQGAGISSSENVKVELPLFDDSGITNDEEIIATTSDATIEQENDRNIASERGKRESPKVTQTLLNDANTSMNLVSSEVLKFREENDATATSKGTRSYDRMDQNWSEKI